MIHVVLYEPEKPANTGNIMRTCMAAGAILHLIEPLGFYVDDRHLKRAGMDYIEELEWHVHRNWEAFCEAYPSDYIYVSRYGQKSPDEIDYTKEPEDIFLVFGKESTGIPYQIMKDHLDRQIRIPMVPSARSLNLSNAAGIVLYEVLRQLGYPGLSRTEVIKGADYRGNPE